MNFSTKDDIKRVFDKQSLYRWEVAETSAEVRREKLRRLKSAIISKREQIAQAIHDDFRKPLIEVELTEIHPAIEEINFTIKHLARWMAPQSVKTPMVLFGTKSEIRYEPKGVVLIFSPWNYPFSLLANPLAAAIAAGNCVVTKPSEKTPHFSQLFEAMIGELFDEKEVAVVQGAGEVGDALLELPFDHIFFTGSTRVGRRVAEAAARNLTPVTLELGGKSPAIIDESADLGEAAKRIVWGKFVNAGQTCIAPDYVFVHRSRQQEWIEAAKKKIEASYGATEEDRKSSSDFCRVIDGSGFSRLKGLVDQTVAAGARVEIGGRFDPASRYISPTILSNVLPEHAIMSDEIFGPVLPVLPFEEWNDVYRHIRSHGKPLALYLFSRNSRRIEDCIRKTTAGGTAINQALLHYANPYLPFGGVGESGQGSYHGLFGFKTFSHERAVLRQGSSNLSRFLYPPYGTSAHRIALKILRRVE